MISHKKEKMTMTLKSQKIEQFFVYNNI